MSEAQKPSRSIGLIPSIARLINVFMNIYNEDLSDLTEHFLSFDRYEKEKYKFVLHGDGKVGKTYLFRAYASGRTKIYHRDGMFIKLFSEDYSVDDKVCKIELRDFCDYEVHDITEEHARGAYKCDGVFLVFALNNRDTFDHLLARRSELLYHMEMDEIPCVVLANMCDVADDMPIERRVTDDEIQTWCNDHDMKWFKTSNRDEDMPNMQRAIDVLVRKIRANQAADDTAKISSEIKSIHLDSGDGSGNGGVSATANIDIPGTSRSGIDCSDSECALINKNDSPPGSIHS